MRTFQAGHGLLLWKNLFVWLLQPVVLHKLRQLVEAMHPRVIGYYRNRNILNKTTSSKCVGVGILCIFSIFDVLLGKTKRKRKRKRAHERRKAVLAIKPNHYSKTKLDTKRTKQPPRVPTKPKEKSLPNVLVNVLKY